MARTVSRLRATKAEDLLRSLSQSDLNKMSFLDLAALQRKFGGKSANDNSCTSAICDFEFHVNNRPLHLLRWAPLTELNVTIQLRQNHVSYASVSMFAYSKADRAHGVGAWTQVFPTADPEMPPFSLAYKHGSTYRWEAVAQLRPGATLEERTLAFAYDTSCMYRWKGCNDSGEIVPSWWKREPPHSANVH